ncbi:MAG: hypothetical protein H7Z41_14015 [Cytophagales bacterium]|nr:hypothetical protein [Armatimonadota bacterium]
MAREIYVASGVSPAVGVTVPTAGANTNSGTSTAPLLTIQAAANIAQPGDTVIVKDGLYTENVTIGYDTYYNRWVNSTTGTATGGRIRQRRGWEPLSS